MRSGVGDSRGSRRLQLLAAALLVGFIGLPLVRLLGVAAGPGAASVVATLAAPEVSGPIFNSAWTAGLVALIAVGLGVAAALATERGNLPGRGLLRAGMLLPLIAPPFVTAFGWARAYGPRGLTDQLLGLQVPGLYGPVGIILVLAASAMPLAWLIVAGALASRVEPDAERAARAAGAGPWTTLRAVTIPLVRPAVVSSLVVTFVFSVNAFGVPAVLGTPAGFVTITTRLYQDLARSADPALFAEAAILAATLVVVAIAVVGPADAWLTGRAAARTGESAGAPIGVSGKRRLRMAASLSIAGGIALLTVVPLIAVLLTAITRAVGLPPVPVNWTLANFAEVLDQRFADGLAQQPDPGRCCGDCRAPAGCAAGGAGAPARAVADGCDARVRPAGVGAGDRRPARLRELAARYAGDHPRRLRRQVLGPRSASGRRLHRPLAGRRHAGRPGERGRTRTNDPRHRHAPAAAVRWSRAGWSSSCSRFTN